MPDSGNGRSISLRAEQTAPFLHGAPGGSRTPNPQIRSLMLYPLSYGRIRVSFSTIFDGLSTCTIHDGLQRNRMAQYTTLFIIETFENSRSSPLTLALSRQGRGKEEGLLLPWWEREEDASQAWQEWITPAS